MCSLCFSFIYFSLLFYFGFLHLFVLLLCLLCFSFYSALCCKWFILIFLQKTWFLLSFPMGFPTRLHAVRRWAAAREKGLLAVLSEDFFFFQKSIFGDALGKIKEKPRAGELCRAERSWVGPIPADQRLGWFASVKIWQSKITKIMSGDTQGKSFSSAAKCFSQRIKTFWNGLGLELWFVLFFSCSPVRTVFLCGPSLACFAGVKHFKIFNVRPCGPSLACLAGA